MIILFIILPVCLTFQCVEDPSLGGTLSNICPDKFRVSEKGTYTWSPPGFQNEYTPRTRRRLANSKNENLESFEPLRNLDDSDSGDDDSDEEGSVEEREWVITEEELKEAKARGEKIMTQLKDRNVEVPVSSLLSVILLFL